MYVKRFGVKLFIICDVETDYIPNFLIFTGEKTNYKKTNPKVGISGAVVNTLLSPYLNKGHDLYIDNWYSSPELAHYLH